MKRIDGILYPTVDETKISGFFGEYRFLSNFHICNVEVDGILYGSSEAAYMAQKTDDHDIKMKFASITVPREAKKLGRKIDLIPNWDSKKLQAMLKVNYAKYTQNPELRKLLIETGDKILIEENYWNDVYWGVCSGKGENMLGKVLMKIRDEIST